MINVAKIILFGMKTSIRNGLADYWGKLDGTGLMRDNGSPSGFSKARSKLSDSLFSWIMREVADDYSVTTGFQTWHGYHVYGIDGSTLRLPDSADIREDFEVEAGEVPIARVSQLVEVQSGIVIDAQVVPQNVGERELALDHLERLEAGSVVLMDRGYPAGWLFSAMESRGIHFVARVQPNNFSAVVDFATNPNERDKTVEIPLTRASRAFARDNDLPIIHPLTVRLIKVQLPSGEDEILMTNLFDDSLGVDDFAHLYNMRWGCETSYRYQKCWAGLEHFSGRSALSVRQDFFAHIVLWNLAAATADRLDEQVPPTPKYVYKVNRVSALAVVRNALVALLSQTMAVKRRIATEIDRMALASTNPIRPGRSFPRTREKRNPLNPVVLAIS